MSKKSYFVINKENRKITFYNYNDVTQLINKHTYEFLLEEQEQEPSLFDLAIDICEGNGKSAILNKYNKDKRISEMSNYKLASINKQLLLTDEKTLVLEAGTFLK
jgi:hypothetical protein